MKGKAEECDPLCTCQDSSYCRDIAFGDIGALGKGSYAFSKLHQLRGGWFSAVSNLLFSAHPRQAANCAVWVMDFKMGKRLRRNFCGYAIVIL